MVTVLGGESHLDQNQRGEMDSPLMQGWGLPRGRSHRGMGKLAVGLRPLLRAGRGVVLAFKQEKRRREQRHQRDTSAG